MVLYFSFITKAILYIIGFETVLSILYYFSFCQFSFINSIFEQGTLRLIAMSLSLMLIAITEAEEKTICIYLALSNCLAISFSKSLGNNMLITSSVLHRAFIVLVSIMIIFFILRLLLGSSFNFYIYMLLAFAVAFTSHMNPLGVLFDIYIYDYQAYLVYILQGLLGLYCYLNEE